MNRSLRAAAFAAVFVLAAAFLPLPALAAGQGRILGTVVDETGAPVADVKVKITRASQASYLQEKTTDKKGQFTVLVLDATVEYHFTLERDGYVKLEMDLKPRLEDTLRQTFNLIKAKVAPVDDPVLKAHNEAIAAFNEGVAAFNANDMTLAESKFRQAIGLDEKLVPARVALAEVLIDQKKWPEALAAADDYLKLEPASVRGLQNRFDAVKEMGDPAATNAALEALIAVDKSRETAVRVFNLGAEASRAGNVDESIAKMRRAVEVDPTLDPAWSALASLYLRRKAWDDALATADQILARNGGDLEAMALKAEAYRGKGDKKKADEIQAAMKAASESSTPEALMKQAIALYNSNNLTQAREAFEAVLAKQETNARAHYLLGNILAGLSENAAARTHLTRFLELAPNDPDAEVAQGILSYLK